MQRESDHGKSDRAINPNNRGMKKIMQHSKYRLLTNEGFSKDCLIIAIGRIVEPEVKDDIAQTKGWEIIEQGIKSMDVAALQALHVTLKDTYSNNEVECELSKEAPKDAQELKDECQKFITQLKLTVIQKGIELLQCLSDDYKKNNLHIVDKDRLEQHAGSLYAEFKESVSQHRKFPQYIVSNGDILVMLFQKQK